jgi:hypothetical protein
VPFAAAFGVLLAVEDLYLGWLVWSPDPGLDWFLVVPLLLAAGALAGAFLVLAGRRGGWLVLALAALLPLLAVLLLVFVLGSFGAGAETAAALLLLVGPLGALVLALRRPVRQWSSARRSPGGRRGTARDR